MTNRKAIALRYGIATPFDSHANGIDRLEAPQVVGGARRLHLGNAIADREGGEPYEQYGDRNGDRQRNSNTGRQKTAPPRPPLTEHTLFERIRSIRNLPFLHQTFQSGIVTCV